MKKLVYVLSATGLITSSLHGQKSGKELQRKLKYVGLLISYDGAEKENVRSTLENIISSNEKLASLKIGGGYLFSNRMSVGLGVIAGTDKTDKEVKNTIGPNTTTHAKTNQFGFSPNIRNFLSLDKNHYFYLYAQTGLEFGFGEGSETSTTGANTTMTDIRSSTYGVSFTPGLMAFVKNGFAFEISVGVGGVNYTKETRKTQGQPDAVIKETSVDLNIDILKMNLGFSYYFK